MNSMKCTRILTDYILYENGAVWSMKSHRYLKPTPDKDGYLTLNISGKVRKLHRLVAEAFLPNPDNHPEVNHKDFNRANPAVDNLEWTTRAANIKHSSDNYAKSYSFLSPDGVRIDIHNLRKWCEDKPDLCRHSMAKLHRGALKTYKGWTKYEE